MKPKPLTLTTDQQRAISSRRSTVILAGAGSGKTFVLIEKAADLILTDKRSIKDILIVTFSEKAASEIRRRLSARLGYAETSLPQGSVGTLHAFATNLLRSRGSVVGIPPDFTIMEESLANLDRLRTVRTKLLELIDARHPAAIDAIERYGFHNSVRLFIDLLQLSCRHSISPQEYADVVAELRKTFFDRKRSRNLLDFNDLETLTLELLSREEESTRLQDQFPWIIVDEFQDINPVQWKILSHIYKPGKNHLVVVGDPRQSIYRFRGADPTLFAKVRQEIETSGGETIFLNENFRSSRKVIGHVNQVAATLFGSDFPPLRATRASTGLVDHLAYDPGDDVESRRQNEAESVTSLILNLHQDGHPWDDFVLLFRNRLAVAHYEKAFRSSQIPYVTRAGESLLERPEVISLVLLLEQASLQGKPDSDPQVRLNAMARGYSPLKDVSIPVSPEALVFFLEAVFEASLPCFQNPWHIANLKLFKKLLEGLLQLGEKDLPSLVSSLQVLREENARISCAPEIAPPDTASSSGTVKLMTVHESKGLEFPIVIVCDLKSTGGRSTYRYLHDMESGEIVLKESDTASRGLKSGSVKSTRFLDLEAAEKEAETEESKRLLYVALTRAEERLILPIPRVMQDSKPKKVASTTKGWADWVM